MNIRQEQQEVKETKMTAVERVALKRKSGNLETSRDISANSQVSGLKKAQSNVSNKEFKKKTTAFSSGSNNLLNPSYVARRASVEDSAPKSNRRASADDVNTTQNDISALQKSVKQMRYDTNKKMENMEYQLKSIRNENKKLKQLILAGFKNMSQQNSDSSSAKIAQPSEDSARWSEAEEEGVMNLTTYVKDF